MSTSDDAPKTERSVNIEQNASASSPNLTEWELREAERVKLSHIEDLELQVCRLKSSRDQALARLEELGKENE
ncbi:MAG: hypothetical protein AB7G93_09615 [Bdellovibrionales bacterium]